jgi:CDP-diglyceride synthetase
VAAFLPQYHEMVMPMAVSFLMLWLLIFNKEAPKIAEISTSLLGMYYIGYLPSFWVRLRSIDAITSNHFTVLFQSFKWMNAEKWTLGAIMTWWTWCSIVFADVGAYFIGKNFGKTKLSAVCAAAGFASPNKTVEGAIGGMAACSLFSILGAYLMKYPYWPVLGFLYGIILSFIGLLGDLTASVMKRDAGMKDSGTILPGHGGLLDRIDSYMFSGPISYLFCKNMLPYLTVLGTGSKVLLRI